MDRLSAFAMFLQQYGPFAMAAVFAGLYMLERRERKDTQTKYEKHLVEWPAQMREFASANSHAVENLERAFARSGISAWQRNSSKKDQEND